MQGKSRLLAAVAGRISRLYQRDFPVLRWNAIRYLRRFLWLDFEALLFNVIGIDLPNKGIYRNLALFSSIQATFNSNYHFSTGCHVIIRSIVTQSLKDLAEMITRWRYNAMARNFITIKTQKSETKIGKCLLLKFIAFIVVAWQPCSEY